MNVAEAPSQPTLEQKSGRGEISGEPSLLKKKGSWNGGGRERQRGSVGKDSQRRGRRVGAALNEFQCVPECTLKVSLLCILGVECEYTHLLCANTCKVWMPTEASTISIVCKMHIDRYTCLQCKCHSVCSVHVQNASSMYT